MRASDGFDCDCGQNPITVVLVGCTQHGKSSVIRTLLDYAGRKTDADGVKTGNYGNSSSTKECHTFSISIKIRKHELMDNDGKVLSVNSADDVHRVESMGDVNFDDDDDESDDSGLKHVSWDSGRHIHLRIIDTPGLDDSDNAKKTCAAADDLGMGVPTRVEDEKHKMAILKAIALEGKINSICFVISTEQQFTDSVPKILREYKSLFNSSGFGGNYHFLHTKVNPSDVWEKMKTRPKPVNRAFSIWTASHHFINNLPMDPLSEYLSHRAIANLLTALAEDEVQTVNGLKYPKTDAHRFMETYLRDALGIDEEYYKKLAKKSMAEISELEERQAALEARQLREWDIWLGITRDVEALDTHETVPLTSPCSRSHPATWFTWSRVDFDISTDFPVREIEKSPKSPENCDWQGAPDRHWKGKCQYRQGMVCREPNQAIQATVQLFGWKKEIEASRIQQLSEERDEAEGELERTAAELWKIEQDIVVATTAKETNQRRASETAAQKMFLKENYIDSDVIKSNGQYLATTSLISYGIGLGITKNWLYRSQLPQNVDEAATARAGIRYTARLKAFTSMLETCDAMVKNLQERGKMLEEMGRRLEGSQARIKSAKKTIEGRSCHLTERTSPVSDEFEPVLEGGRETVVEAMRQDMIALERRFEFTENAREMLSDILENHGRAVEKWEAKRCQAKTSMMAAQATLDVALQRDRSSPGRFAVLKRGIDVYGASSHKVWDGLFHELQECYRNAAENWEAFLEEI